MIYYERKDILAAFERGQIDANWDQTVFDIDKFINALDFTPSIPMEEEAEWFWDPDGMDWGIGAWRCQNCHSRNANLFGAPPHNPMRCSGSKFCPTCGRKMTYKEE